MTPDNDAALIDVLDRLRNRFFGKYRGVVANVDAKTLRIKATVPSVLAGQPTGWCRACVPYAGNSMGFAFLPEIGAGVWIEFEGGDVSYPIWTGCFWHDGEQPSQATAAVKVIVTRSGHSILLDDDGVTITLSDQNGNAVTLGPNGITQQRGANSIAIGDAKVDVNDGALEVM